MLKLTFPPDFSHPAAIDTDALYHCDAPANSTRMFEPAGTGSVVTSSINGILGKQNSHYDITASELWFLVRASFCVYLIVRSHENVF